MATTYRFMANDGTIQETADLLTWQAWNQQQAGALADTIIRTGANRLRISTRVLDPTNQTAHRFETVVTATPHDIQIAAVYSNEIPDSLRVHQRAVDGWLWYFEHTLQRRGVEVISQPIRLCAAGPVE